MAAYMEEVRLWLGKLADKTVDGIKQVGDTIFYTDHAPAAADGLNAVQLSQATIHDFVGAYDLSIFNPMLLGGIFLGAMMAFVFCAMTMKAVGRAAGAMVDEVRRQFREIPGIMEGKATPEYAKCVEISTKGVASWSSRGDWTPGRWTDHRFHPGGDAEQRWWRLGQCQKIH